MVVRCALLLLATAALATAEGPVRHDHVEVELVSAGQSVRPGGEILIGLRFLLDDRWHVYWRNPGDSGLAPTVKWTLPEGVEAGPILWPAPHRLPAPGLMNFGYGGELVLPVRLTVPADWTEPKVTIAAEVDWLICENDIGCIEGDARIELALPVAARAPRPSRWRPLFDHAASLLPRPRSATATRADGKVLLHLRGIDADGAEFFPGVEMVFQNDAEQPVTRKGGRLTLALTPSAERQAPIDRVTGVVVVETAGRRTAFAVDARVTGPGKPSGMAAFVLLGCALAGIFAWALGRWRPRPETDAAPAVFDRETDAVEAARKENRLS